MTTNNEFVSHLITIRPEERQINWQSLDFTLFFHFGVNTFTGREWGDGTESPAVYDPADLNTDQWCEALVSAGAKACIITAKHHDGFCLFDSAYTGHSVKNSPKPLDVVASLSKSCGKYGVKLGVYLSPWDRHEKTYGSGKPYDDYFCAQLEELTTNYGPLYTVWFDGACGEGPNGKVQVYDWNRYYEIIRRNQPDAVISISGPDVRWIGNEAGATRPCEWSVVPARLRDNRLIAERSQRSDDQAFRVKPLSEEDEDLGSREFLESEEELCWYPAEVDVSIRPGWFYHKEEDNKVRSVENLLNIYERSVGGNAVLLLNVPPDTAGRISTFDSIRLRELGDRIRSIYTENLLADAKISLEDTLESRDLSSVLIDDESYWIGDKEKAEIIITLPEVKKLTHFVLSEQIRESQRIEEFTVSAMISDTWQEIHRGTTVGYKKICRFDLIETRKLKLMISKSRIAPTLRFIAGYYDSSAIIIY